MSVDTSHTITRFLCWSSTGNAAARPMPAQHCISGRAHRRNTASAPLIQTQSPDRAPQSQHPCALDGFWHPPRQGQIAIARGAFPTSTPRGFLPWGLSDDGPSACPHSRDGPSSETLHTQAVISLHARGPDPQALGSVDNDDGLCAKPAYLPSSMDNWKAGIRDRLLQKPVIAKAAIREENGRSARNRFVMRGSVGPAAGR